MKKTKLFVALASMLALASAASATTDVRSLGTLTDADVTGAVTLNLATGTSFTEYLTFTVAGTYLDVSGSIGNSPMITGFKNPETKFDISNLAASLYAGDLCLTGCSSPLQNATHITADYGLFDANSGFMSGRAPAGDYIVKVTGIATGTQGGKFSYDFYAAPVPEPETYAMFLAGLGLMGAIARRRRS